MRTLRLSTQSFLGAVIYEDSKPLYTLETEEFETVLSRHSDKDAESMARVATVSWSELESPDTSPVDSPSSLTSRFLQSWTSRDSKEERGVSIQVDGRHMKQGELLKTSALGSSRSFHVHGKRFSWKHINGLWQCFRSKRLVALFEPSILTAPARIRIMVPELLKTPRILDMIVLTCMLVVTHPADWRRHQASTKASPPSSPRRPRASRQRTMPEARQRPPTHSATIPRTPSNEEVRIVAPAHRNSTDSQTSLSSDQSSSSSQDTPTPTIGQPAVGRITPPLVLSRLTIPTSTPEDSPMTPTPRTAVRRVSSVNELRTPVSRSLPTTPSNIFTIISRSNTVDDRCRSLHRSPSAHALSSPSMSPMSPLRRLHTRSSVGTALTSVPDECPLTRYSSESDMSSASTSPSASDGYDFTPSGRRPWEYVDAYPMPYAAVQPSTPVVNGDRNLPGGSPPPYSRRDPLASPTPQSPRPPAHRRTSSTPRTERSVQLVIVS
ncbi:hypothetical protein FRB97_002122 [Tulasnella sp. 331]|nr:hypothetical protein FRB97_002122 [Tulasnella sp. 331]